MVFYDFAAVAVKLPKPPPAGQGWQGDGGSSEITASAPGDQFEWPRALALLAALRGEPKSGVTKDEAVKFADQSVAALRDAIKAGWSQPAGLDEFEEPDFDAPRGREVFKKLLADVEAKAAASAKPKD